MATTLNPDHPLVSISFTADTDFTVRLTIAPCLLRF